MDMKSTIAQLMRREDLSSEEMIAAMRAVMSGATDDAQNAAFLVALQMKGPVVAEVFGGASVMRELATSVPVNERQFLVDTCGTGGSGSNKFNVSTASALVAACGGACVAKQGNRGASSKSGSADVLEAAGVALGLSAASVAACIEQLGVGFMFAPAHHSAMKHVIGARKSIGVRTVFNVLGPLTNPAGAPNQVMGVYSAEWIPVLLDVLQRLGSDHVMVVAADDGLDEISIAAETKVGELRDGELLEYVVSPEEFGMRRRESVESLRIDSPQQSLAMLRAALIYENEDAGDIVALNAGAALYTAGVEGDLAAGVARAQGILQAGEALKKLEALTQLSQSLAG